MAGEHWTARHGKSIIFVILTFVAAGIYLAMTIPVAVFPEVDFPRVLVGVDNGVAPIDQMMVTITRPIEEAVNSVQGLQTVQSTTSRGSAEINLFFNWGVDMDLTLQRVDAAIARVQSTIKNGTLTPSGCSRSRAAARRKSISSSRGRSTCSRRSSASTRRSRACRPKCPPRRSCGPTV